MWTKWWNEEVTLMNSNFDFLQSEFPVLATFGCQAEKYCFSDPNSCLMKLGMIGETIECKLSTQVVSLRYYREK